MTGFTDVAPVVREQTVKAVLTIITKLSDRTINGELLKYLARTSNDEQPGIRTNTTICLGRISKNLGVSTRGKVLIAAFTRSLRDPFVHARNAALMALGATVEVFSDDDCAQRILPALCPTLVDKEKLVRDSANKTFDAYLARIRKLAKTLPDSVLPPPSAGEANHVGNGAAPRMGTPQPEAASWTGWAISSFTNKVSAAAGEITSSNGNSTADNRPTSAPPNPQTSLPRPSNPSVSALHRQAVTSPPISTRTSISSNAATAHDFFDASTGLDDENLDAWGDMDDDFNDDDTKENNHTSTTGSKILAGGAKKTTTTTTRPTAPVSAANPFGVADDAEPDFAGWLAASSSKKAGGKPLPKGLAAKSTNTERPGNQGRSATTGSLGTTKSSTLAAKAKPAPAAKKVDIKPKALDDDDGWGDGW